ncbi:MAG: hypothetical protein LAT77_01405 [Aliidiomarina sp.]|uniref:hypothetical protein n=1 Tax=Aliidiomarina sp. TaxID=1872439 RepID=UPI0025C05F3E|nr:hypothetical protein [Aliidiomarina sp.]MCH8500549.1 hypothetical protein [Aliidiomarina sp.]
MAVKPLQFTFAALSALILSACVDSQQLADYENAQTDESGYQLIDVAFVQHLDQILNEDREVDASDIELLNKEINALVAIPTAENVQACAVVGYGSKPCGGPSRWLIYSRQVTDDEVLLPLVERYNRLTEQYNQQEGMMSDCAMLEPVQPQLINGVCAAGSRHLSE